MVRRTSIIIALLISSAPAALSAQRAPTTPETTAPATGEIIMRRPIPGTRGSSTPVTPSNPEGEEETIPQPDGNPDYSGINATYYATASCESNSISLTCIEMQNNGTTVTFQTTSSLGACELQDESTPDYQYAVANGPIPEGGVIVPPQEGLSSYQGAECRSTGIESVTYHAVSCGSEGDGRTPAAPTQCFEVNVETANGERNVTGADAPDGACAQDYSYANDPAYIDLLFDYGLREASSAGFSVCNAENEPGFFVDSGSCKTQSDTQADGSTNITTYYDWDCYKISNFTMTEQSTGRGTAMVPSYDLNSISDLRCRTASQSAEDRQTIANYFVPSYNDPELVDTTCKGSIGVLDDYRIEVGPDPYNTIHRSTEQFFNKREDYSVDARDSHIYEEQYVYYCHRYAGSIFEIGASNPEAFTDSLYVAHPRSTGFENEPDCYGMAEQEAARLAPPQHPDCPAIWSKNDAAGYEVGTVETFCRHDGQVNGTNTGYPNSGNISTYQRIPGYVGFGSPGPGPM